MAFELLVRPRGKPANKSVVSVQKGPTNVVFSFGEDLCKSLGWKVSDRVNMYVGTGADDGRIRFIGEVKGEYQFGQLSQNSKTLKLTRRMVPGFPEGKFSRFVMRHEVIDGGLEATLPAADELVPTQPSFRKGTDAAKPLPSAPRKPTSIFDQPVKLPAKPVSEAAQQIAGSFNRRCPSCSKVFETNNLRRTHCETCAPISR